MLDKGADVIFHAGGSDGVGVIQAVKEARAAGKRAWVIGVDSDQWTLAPEAVLTSMIKRVDLAVYQTTRDLVRGRFEAGKNRPGGEGPGGSLAEGGMHFPGEVAALQRVEAL